MGNKYAEISDSHSGSETDSDYVPPTSDTETEVEIEEESFDRKEYQKFLMNMFPSKYLANKIKNQEDNDDENENENDILSYGDESSTISKNARSKTKSNKYKTKKRKFQQGKSKQNNKQSKSTKSKKNSQHTKQKSKKYTNEEDEEDVIDLYKNGDSDYDDSEEDEHGEVLQLQGLPFNIVLNIQGDEEDEGDEGDDYTDSSEDEDEDEDNDTKKKSKKTSSNEEISSAVDKINLYSANDMKSLVKMLEAMKKEENKPDMNIDTSIKIKEIETNTKLSGDKNKNNNKINEVEVHLDSSGNQTINNMIQTFKMILKEKEEEEKKVQKRVDKKEKKKLKKEYAKLIKENTNLNDLTYFKKQDIEQQKHIVKMLQTIKKMEHHETPYRIRLIESNLDDKFKAIVLKKINMLKKMDPYQGEYYKLKNWVDNFMMIPFGVYKTLDVSLDDGVDKCNDFMMNAKSILDDVVYGLNDAKMQILQMLGQLITNPSSVGSSIAIKGPMGTGKTTLVKEGISKILKRPFAFIALGGATDSVFLEGHSYTYEGSTWGHIVEILKQSKCMNPVIYFDELDKVSDTAKGEEIIGILTHLTDTTQNSQFHDKYFAGIDFDLSKCLFIFSYNDENKINPILRDRMYKISTEGYKPNEKKVIAKKHLIPAVAKNTGFERDSIDISDDVFDHIIENYTGEERGVRNLKRCIEIIFTKLNMFRLMKPGTKLYDDFETLNIEFPYKLNKETMQKLLKKNKKSEWLTSMYT